jgi:PEP-CTERM motif
MKRFVFSALAIALIFSGQAKADIVFNLPGTHTGTLGTSQSFTSTPSGYTLTAYGFNSTLSNSNHTLTLGTATDLYGKTGGGGETGLGIANDPTRDHEIYPRSTVKIDLTSVFSTYPTEAVTLTVGSVQNGEGFAVFGGSSSPSNYIGSVTSNSNSNDVFTFNVTASQVAASGDKLYLTATSNNVVLETVTVASVPEPGTFGLMFTGIAAITGYGWLRRRKAA